MEHLSFDVIWLCGMPRSGTSWLSQIFDSAPTTTFRMAPLFSYEFKNKVDEHSSDEELLAFFKAVYDSDDAFLLQKDRRARGDFPSLGHKLDPASQLVIKDVRYQEITERLVQLSANVKIVNIVRHPCAAIYSWLNAKKEFPAEANLMEEWYTGSCRKENRHEYWGFKDWKEQTSKFIQLAEKYPDKVMVIHYDKMVLQPEEEVRQMFAFCNIEMNENTLSFLDTSNAKNDQSDYSVFKDKSVVSKWKGQLHPEIVSQIIREVENTPLEKYLQETFK